MDDADQDKIKSTKDRIAEMRANMTDIVREKQDHGEAEIQRFEEAWKPLTDYLAELGEACLSEEQKLTFSFSFKDGRGIVLLIDITSQEKVQFGHASADNPPQHTEKSLTTIAFIERPSSPLSLLCFGGSLSDNSNNEIDTLHVEEMEQAKDAITNWMAKVVACDFDLMYWLPLSFIKQHFPGRNCHHPHHIQSGHHLPHPHDGNLQFPALYSPHPFLLPKEEGVGQTAI